MPALSLQTISRAVSEHRHWDALIDLNQILARIPVVPPDLFLIRSGVLAALGLEAASYADSKRAEMGRGQLPATVSAAVTQAISPAVEISPAELTVIVPVRNGGAIVRHCLESLVRDLPTDVQVLLIDDGTEDAETLGILDQQADLPGVILQHHAGPPGFVAAVNAGLRATSPGHVLLLNSDTYVPRGTLTRLLSHLRAGEMIGTVTPFSNHGGSFTIPSPRRRYAMPSPDECEEIAAVAHTSNQGVLCDVLTSNGFAMAITAACRQALPQLSVAFGSGYYEEVDYCLRARSLGYRNVCATDCFVGHVGSVSFGQDKRRLANDNLVLLAALHPDYEAEFARYAASDPLRHFRKAIVAQTDWAPVVMEPEDEPGFQTVELPGTLSWRGRERYLLPVTGPINSARLDLCTPRIRWLNTGGLLAQGLQLLPSHGIRSALVEADGRARLALSLDGKVLSSINFSITRSDRDAIDVPQFASTAVHLLEQVYGPV